MARCVRTQEQHAVGNVLRLSGLADRHRRLGDLFGSSGAFAPGGNLVQIGVSMTPGCTEFTRMLSRALAHSSAIDLANSRTAPLVAL